MTGRHSRGQRSRAHGARFAAGLLLVYGLVGCGISDSGLQRDTAHRLQELVLGVTQAAAMNDHATALTRLDNLQAEVELAARSGRISEDRRRSIMTNAAALQADLAGLVDAAAEAAMAAEKAAAAAEAAEVEKAKADAESATKAALTQEGTAPAPVAPAPPPAPAPEPQQGKGNEGKGKNKND